MWRKFIYKLNFACFRSTVQFFGFSEKTNYGWKRIRNEFLIKIEKNSQIASKIFVNSHFSIATWITTLLMKQLADCPQQILANYMHISGRTFQPLWVSIEAFRMPWIIWQIGSLLNSLNFEFSTNFRESIKK